MRTRIPIAVTALWVLAAGFCEGASAVENLSQNNAPEFFFRFPVSGKISGVIVIAPGEDGDGSYLLRNKEWSKFCDRYDLVLGSFHLVSDHELLRSGGGYYVASSGSGGLLLDALRRHHLERTPLLLYGFSGGAHFVVSFVNWHPQGIKAFCAYTFAWSERPNPEVKCPALIACGIEDGLRYGASYTYFQEGRKQGKQWVWVSLKDTGHQASPALDDFMRAYFASILEGGEAHPVEVDNITKRVITKEEPSIKCSVLPSEQLLPAWQALHQP